MEYLKFTVDSALLRELGEKLVETVYLALVELVKNSYDADATEVKVIFDQNEEGESEIQIIDDGIGMNFEAVQNYWMRIATTIKAEQNISPLYGRPKTGAKGIGRFSCRRLGNKLRLITIGSADNKVKKGSRKFQKTEIEFHWTEFEPGTELTLIKCPGNQYEVESINTGTTLIINGIDEQQWNLRGFNWLKRQLAVLAANRGIKRKRYQEDPGFNIKLIAPDFEGGIRDIREDFLNAGWGTLTAYINKKHQAVCELNALGIGRNIYTSSQTFPNLKDISLEIGIMVDDREQMRDTSVISKGTLKKILEVWGGVQIRFHGFRVYPFGDVDWLGIDRDRGLRKGSPSKELFSFAQTLKGVDPGRSLLNLLSMRNYVGNVEIDANAEGFEMKASREGFISSPAVDELEAFVRFTIDWATIYRDFYLRNKLKKESEEARESLEEIVKEKIDESEVIKKAVHYIQKEVNNIVLSLPPSERKRVEESIDRATDAIIKHDRSNKEELFHLRLIASTSTLLLIFSHEVRSLLGLLEQSKNSLAIIESKLTGNEQKSIKDIRERIFDLKARFEELLNMTALIGVDSRKAKPGQIALRERVVQAENIFQLIINSYEIKLDYDQVPNNIIIKSILEAELYAILLNVLSNSIKSIIAAGGNRKIQITANRENGMNVIRIRDNGLGIDPSFYEEAFIPFIADPEGKLYRNLDNMLNPEDKYIVGTGSGLGLSIVREIVQVRNGKITFCTPKEGWKAELEISLP